VATIAKAKQLLEENSLARNGKPDWLLLKKGGVWDETLGQWRMSGRSADERLLVSSYGDITTRPLLRTGPNDGVLTNGGGGSPTHIDHVAFVGLHFQARTYGGTSAPNGVIWLQPSNNLLIEDCMFESYETNLIIQAYPAPARHNNFQLRRNVIVDAYNTGSGTVGHGLYMYGVDGALIEENVFDHNGWNEAIPGTASIFRHTMYLQNGNSGVIVRRNIIANGASHGVQLRSGGIVEDNLFVRSSIALLVGGGNNPAAAGVQAEIKGNVIVEGKNIDAANVRGWGMEFSNISAASIHHNVIANMGAGLFPMPISIDALKDGDTTPAVGVHDADFNRNIIYNWGGTVQIKGNVTRLTNLQFSDNQLQKTSDTDALLSLDNSSYLAAINSSANHLFSSATPSNAWVYITGIGNQSMSQWLALINDTTSSATTISYPDAARSVASYHGTLGGTATYDAFIQQARLQSKDHWRPEYLASAVNNYIRAGFSMSYP
jgi:hypothetical protein